MKRVLRSLLLAAALAALVSVCALAADKGFTEVKALYENVTLTPQTADKTAVAKQNEAIAYPEAVRIAMTYSAAESGKNYLLIATKKDVSAPTAADIVYMDQVKAADGEIHFNVYPGELKNDTPCYIYLSGGSLGWTKIATYTYHRDYTLGDVDDDGEILAKDAMFVLQYSVNIPTQYDDKIPTAGDVDGDGEILAKDAMFILRYSVCLIDKWPVENG